MPGLISAKCPECGARLEVNPLKPTVRCAYCGAQSRVPGVHSDMYSSEEGVALEDLPMLKLKSPMRWIWAVMAMLTLLALMVLAFYSMGQPGSTLSDDAPRDYPLRGASPDEKMEWDSNLQAMLVDVNADGKKDPIGWVRFPSTMPSVYAYHLGAFNAVDGARLWISEQLSTATQLTSSRASIVQNHLLHVDSGGLLRCLSPVNGNIRWSAVMGGKSRRICDGGKSFARIEMMDATTRLVRLSDGQVVNEPSSEPNEPCTGVWSDRNRRSPLQRTRFSLAGAQKRDKVLVDGFSRVSKMIYDEESTLAAAIGDRVVKTREQPHILTFDPQKSAPGQGAHREARWMASIDPKVKDYSPPIESPLLTAAHGRVFVNYKVERNQWRMTGFELKSGKRLFDTEISTDKPGAISGSKENLFISVGNRLLILDIATGRTRMAIGS